MLYIYVFMMFIVKLILFKLFSDLFSSFKYRKCIIKFAQLII